MTESSAALPKRGWFSYFAWATVIISFVLSLIVAPLSGKWSPQTVFLTAIPFALIHAYRRYGARGLAVFAGAAWVISNFFENLSIITGFPFGHYHYTDGPQLLYVPIVIGPAYIALGYLSWQTANALLGQIDKRLASTLNAVILPTVAGAMMTVYDIATDPQASTVLHKWIWQDGGGHFGVPYTNYLGWWFVTWSFFQVFALYLHYTKYKFEERTILHVGQSVALWGNFALTVIVSFVLNQFGDGTVRDASGQIWRLHDLLSSQMIFAIFVMGTFTLVALTNLRMSAAND